MAHKFYSTDQQVGFRKLSSFIAITALVFQLCVAALTPFTVDAFQIATDTIGDATTGPMISDIIVANPSKGEVTIEFTLVDDDGINLDIDNTYVKFYEGTELKGSAMVESETSSVTYIEDDRYKTVINTLNFVPDGSEGIYWVYIQAEDNLENANANNDVRDIKIDNLAITQIIGMTIVQNDFMLGCYPSINDRTITVRWDAIADAEYYNFQTGADIVALNDFYSRVDSNEENVVIQDQDNTYYYRVRAVDAAGNVGEWSEWCGVTLDRVNPVLGFSSIETKDTTPELLGDADDAIIVTVTVGDNPGNVASVNEDTWQTNIDSPLAVGTYDVTIVGVDAAGNPSTITLKDGLTILPTPVEETEKNNNPTDSSEDQATTQIASPVIVADANANNRGVNNPDNGDVLGATDIAQANQSAEIESTENDPQVLQTTIDSINDGDIRTLEENYNGCFEIFGICWYWYAIPVIALIGFGVYRVSKDDK